LEATEKLVFFAVGKDQIVISQLAILLFCLPLISFQLPFICSFMTDNSCVGQRSVFSVVELMLLKTNKKTRLCCSRIARTERRVGDERD
jgi:hypothetical protein